MVPPAQVSGVRHNPDSFAEMGRTHIGCGYNLPFRIIPDAGKVADNSSKPSMNEHWYVLNECVSGSYSANEPEHFKPKTRPFTFYTLPLASHTDVLTGKTASEQINANKTIRFQPSNIIVNRYAREVLSQYLLAITVIFTKSHQLQFIAPYPGSGQSETADATE
jgi:hypothetical protein